MFGHDAAFVAEPPGPAVIGLDLSTRAAAAVVVPIDWNGDWRRVSSLVLGEKLKRTATDAERALRTETIAASILSFAKLHNVSVAFFESYAFSRVTSAHSLGELGGVTRLALLKAGIEIRTANMGTARKLLLGRVPRSDVKMAVFAAVRAAGGRFETLDEADAFCAANLGLAELGGYCFAQQAA